jgi:hypothetical protein
MLRKKLEIGLMNRSSVGRVGAGDGDALTLELGEPIGCDGETDGDWLTDGDSEDEGDSDGESDDDGEGDRLIERETDGDTDGDTDADADVKPSARRAVPS